MHQPVKQIALRDFFVEYHDIDKGQRRHVRNLRQISDAESLRFRVKRWIRKPRSAQFHNPYTVEDAGGKERLHEGLKLSTKGFTGRIVAVTLLAQVSQNSLRGVRYLFFGQQHSTRNGACRLMRNQLFDGTVVIV